jgi:hypothetical protein
MIDATGIAPGVEHQAAANELKVGFEHVGFELFEHRGSLSAEAV